MTIPAEPANAKDVILNKKITAVNNFEAFDM
jgi:hypothetical protein